MTAELRNIRLILEYDGSAFFGFQKQPKHSSVQETLEAALSRLFDRPVKIQAASGRTDAGVHAAGQVVNFKIESPMSCGAIQKALNGILPKSLAVLEASEADSSFHARYSAAWKTYEYCIWNNPVRSPLRFGRVCHVSQPLSLSKMKKTASVLRGKQDFRSFCGQDPSREKDRNTVRTLRRLAITRQGSLIRIQAEADGFLYRMVRNLVGVLVEAGLGKLTPAEVKEILRLKDRRKAPKTMPAEGLTLLSVDYSKSSKKNKREMSRKRL